MPVKAPSDLNGEEGSVVTQDNSGSAIAESSITTSDIGRQVDILV
jgi:hypothetical protein